MLEQRVVLAVEVRRFKCANAGCPRRMFAENIHALAGRHQRRTPSQARALHALGHALGGEAAARLANALGLRTSADTVLRELSCVVRLLFPQGKVPLVQAPVRTMPCPSARRVFGWLAGWRKLAVEEPRSADHERFVQALCKIEPMVGEVHSLAREFLGLMHRRSLRQFDRWLKRLSCCDAAEMRRFAQSLRADLPAVQAAFKLPWSNGQTEGHVNRLKFLRRHSYAMTHVRPYMVVNDNVMIANINDIAYSCGVGDTTGMATPQTTLSRTSRRLAISTTREPAA